MPNVKDIAVKVTGVDDEFIHVQIGSNGYSINKTELQNLAYGDDDDFETVKRNIGIALNLANVSISDDIAIKDVIEKRAYKARR